ncbi:YihY/virulence factor BrkB family protein [Demequina flava]|uniref:YihY/virulence factor BrkB family protein n=1 Tax=Demequina flava TaxID=1095025 RepID=UPI0007804FCA|nr:YhjD/YihY/BrkB family envelope integrity protein [Demequina flava]
MSDSPEPKHVPLRDTFTESIAVQKSKTALEDSGAIDKTKAALAEAKGQKEKFDGTHVGRTLKRASEENATILAGGMAYFSLTSLAAGLVIGITLSTFMVHFNEDWNDAFYTFLDDTIPGVVDDGSGNGLVDPAAIQPQTITGIVGLVSFLILFNTAARYLTAVRIGTRAMLGKGKMPAVAGKLGDFAALFAIFLIVVVGVIVQVLASQFADVLASWIPGETVSQWVIRGPALFVGLLVDMAFLTLAIVILGKYRGSKKSLWMILILGGIAMGILRQGVSFVVGGVGSNPVLGSIAAVITIVVFVDWIARIMLYCAAWLGTLPPSKLGDTQETGEIPAAKADSPARRPHGSVTTKRATTREKPSD